MVSSIGLAVAAFAGISTLAFIRFLFFSFDVVAKLRFAAFLFRSNA